MVSEIKQYYVQRNVSDLLPEGTGWHDERARVSKS